MKKIYFASTLLLCSLPAFAVTENAAPAPTKSSFVRLDKIVVIINNEVITQSQIDKETHRLEQQLQHENTPIPDAATLKKMVLDETISKTLQLQSAKERGVSVTDADLDKAISNIAKGNKLSIPQFKQAIEQSGFKYDAYKTQLKEQIFLQKFQQTEIAKGMSFTPDDVRKYARTNQNKSARYNAFHLVDILVPQPENAQAGTPAAKQEAVQIAEQLQKGTDIETILKQHPKAQNNDLGWRSIQEVPSVFQAKVASMSIHAVSAPISAPNGIHILKLLDARGENAQPSESDLKNMAYRLKMNEVVKEWVANKKKEVFIQVK